MAPLAELSSSSSSSPSGGLACAIAALAERQQTGGESSTSYSEAIGRTRFSNREDQVTENYSPAGGSIEVSPDRRLAMSRDDGEWTVDHGSEVAEVGTSYAGSEAAENAAFPQQDEIEGGFQNVTGPIVPESFEEQMMLAMAVSLAEARARASSPEVAWH